MLADQLNSDKNVWEKKECDNLECDNLRSWTVAYSNNIVRLYYSIMYNLRRTAWVAKTI